LRRFLVSFYDTTFTDNIELLKKPLHEKLDRKMIAKLDNWGSIFMSYLIHIYRNEVYGKEIIPPRRVKEMSAKYVIRDDYIGNFINNMIIKSPNPKHRLSIKQITTNFNEWIKTNGYEGYRLKGSDLKEKLERKFDKHYIRDRGIIIGYEIKVEYEDFETDQTKIDATNLQSCQYI